jgi:hypothetical protein
MTSAVLESPLPLFAETRRALAAGGGGATLEARLEEAWHTVQADGRAECPVCRSSMRFEGGAAHCTGCGSTLS